MPLDGIYHFQFSALKAQGASTNNYVFFRVNGVDISASFAPSDLSPFFGLSVIHTSLRLKTGDQVYLFQKSGVFTDGPNKLTHFTGWLIEQDLALA